MRRILFLFIISCFICIFDIYFGYTFSGNELSIIKNSLIERICLEIYRGGHEKPAEPLSIKVKIDNNTFKIWIDNYKIKNNWHMAGYFNGIIKNGQAAIVHNEAYNTGLTPPVPGYIENKSLFENSDTIEDVLTIPRDCTPQYDPMTPQKAVMLRTVIKSIKQELKSRVRDGYAQYPQKVTIIIENFNVDYPSTYIFIKQTDDLFHVILHDSEDYYSGLYERIGAYPLGEIAYKSKSLIERIFKHGIVKTITLDLEE